MAVYLGVIAAGALLVLLIAAPLGHGGPALLTADFETEPTKLGWKIGGYPHEKPKGEWTDETSVSGRHALRIDRGWWASPRLEVTPLQYYRLRFAATVEGKGYWFVAFFDGDGKLLLSDHYSSIYPSDEWRPYEFCFRAHFGAAAAEVRFRSIAAPLFIDDVGLGPIARPEVATWADRMYAQVPPVQLDAVPRAGKLLERTMTALKRGKTLRVVMLGDSIINDIASSDYDVLVERMYPGARIELVNSVRGGTGCPYYREENRVQPFVLDHKPDLLIIGGISNGHDPESIRQVIRQVRAKSQPDILVLSGAVSTKRDFLLHIAKWPEEKRKVAIERARDYRPGLARMTKEEKVEYFDLRAHWDAYVARIRKPPEWLRRDRPHANTRGHMVLARLMAAFFRPAG